MEERGFSLSDIRNMINQDYNADLKNDETKVILTEEFGHSIFFCDPRGRTCHYLLSLHQLKCSM